MNDCEKNTQIRAIMILIVKIIYYVEHSFSSKMKNLSNFNKFEIKHYNLDAS